MSLQKGTVGFMDTANIETAGSYEQRSFIQSQGGGQRKDGDVGEIF